MEKTSLLYWYPKIKDLGIPQPKTEWILLSQEEYRETFDGMSNSLVERIEDLIKIKFELPVFIRTDLSSAKHYWENTCFYDGSEKLVQHLYEICEFNHCADILGLSFIAMVVREYIPMDTRFYAFAGNMPVNPERRYFIKDGKVLCHHPYWIEESIRKPIKKELPENWKELLKTANSKIDSEELGILQGYSEKVAKAINGFWSVDYCFSAKGEWILIDMAVGEKSWHPENCKYSQPKTSIGE